MSTGIQTYLPSLSEFAGLAGLLVVGFGFALVGRVVAGPQSFRDLAILHGWSTVVALFILVGVLRVVPFTAIAVVAAALAVGSGMWLYVRRLGVVEPALLRTVLLCVPVLVQIAAMAPSMWDEFTNWLPNVRYLIEVDAFPGPGLPANPSVVPAYPYALPIVGYLASSLVGHFVENAIALFNLLLLLSLGLLVVRSMRAVIRDRPNVGPLPDDGPDRLTWGWCALAALLPTALNPTFVHKVAFTAYADTGTAVTLGVAAILGWMCLNALADNRQSAAAGLAWQMGLASTALLVVKQVNLVLFIALIGVLILVALRDRRIPVRGLLPLAGRALALPLVVYVVWRVYVGAYIPAGEFSVRPFSGWLLPLLPEIVERMASVASKKGGYFGVMAVALFFAARGLWRMRTEFDRLAVVVGGLFVGYTVFLLFAYVAAFGEWEARRAASYWRYNMHLGGVCVAFIGYGSALLWRRYGTARVGRRLGFAAVALTILLPVALSYKLRFDLHPRYIYAREIAKRIAGVLGPADRLLLVDFEQNGRYQVIMRYHLYRQVTPVGTVTAFHRAGQKSDAETLREVAGSANATHIWVYRPLPSLQPVLGQDLPAGESILLERRPDGWRLLRSWPHSL